MKKLELTDGILKSIESSFYQNHKATEPMYVVKYKGEIMLNGGVRAFKTYGAASSFITRFLRNVFWHGRYWHEYRHNTMSRVNYDIDYSGTIDIVNNLGQVAEFDKNIVKIVGNLKSQLLEQKIITIEEI